MWSRQSPEILKLLREQSIIQSAESSNRIEGVTIERDRLVPVVLGKSRPRDRSEEEIVGYRRALNWIYTRPESVELAPRAILHLHQLAQGGLSGDAGKWKTRDNEIIEFLPNGERKIRFVPTRAANVPGQIDRLCIACRDFSNQDTVPQLLVIATCVFDFLCIHPFRDGNGRVSRLLTTMLLQQAGFIVGRYISLERLVEETKQDYYEILKRCSLHWHEGKNELIPWWNYFLGNLKHAYQEFEQRVEETRGCGKGELVRSAIDIQFGQFALSDIQAQCPSVSESLVKQTLKKMKDSGHIRLIGRGRGAKWEKILHS